jgi:hypothetical protein
MKKTLTAAVLTALAFTLSACGGNDDAEASKAISDSIMKSQNSQDSSASQFLSMKRKDADCIGDGLVDKIGTEKLQKYGLLTKDNKTDKGVGDVKMSASDSESATGVLFDCTDVEGMMQTAITKSGTEKNLRPMFTKIFQGKQEEAQKDLTTPMMKCATGSAG